MEGAELAAKKKYPRKQAMTSRIHLEKTELQKLGGHTMGGLSEKISNWGLATKLSLLFGVFGLMPIIGLGWMAWQGAQNMEAKVGEQFQISAVAIADKIDRSLFERYGDVQAFALNEGIKNTERWYDPSPGNEISSLMDQYVSTYGIYSLTLMVDTKGKVVAVNHHAADGTELPYQQFFAKDYSQAPWFQALSKGEYTSKMPHTAEGNTISSGTYIEDLHIDEDVKRAYPRDEGMTIGFSAPVYGDNGEVLGYWSNRAMFSLVEEVVASTYLDLKAQGFPGAEITLLDGAGNVIVDYDPVTSGKEAPSRNFENVLFKLNLADKGVKAAQEAVAGKTGYLTSLHARKGIVQAGGYTHLKGSLGYPGMNWAVLVRIPQDEAAVQSRSLMNKVWMMAAGCLALILPMGLWIGRMGARQITAVQQVAEKMATGDFKVAVDVHSKDEIGQMGNSFNKLADHVQKTFESKLDALDKTQAIIEFNLDGTIITANQNFLSTLGYTLDEIKGKHHRMFAEPAYAASHEYTAFWEKLNRGESDAGQYKRVGKGGKEVWIQASYNPIFDKNGTAFKVTKFATDISGFMQQAAEYEARNVAVGNGNAVIDFTPEGIILDANQNFLTTMGYRLDEIKGKHHSMFAEPAFAASPEYTAFWAKLNRGEFDSGQYKRIGKGGKEVWIQASYNPIINDKGKTYKIVKFATDVTEAKRLEGEAEENRNRDIENAKKLEAGVIQIAEIGTNLASASEELTSVSSTMGSTAEETSSQANVVAAAAEEVSKNVQSVSTGSEEMTASIQEIAKNTTDAVRVAAQAMTVADSTTTTVAKLGQSSAEIGGIIKVITTIAEQTNLLALNATIEAARAGDAGKGFAVVANEVKELAKETTKATENISRMIETIQDDTKGSVDAIEEISTIIRQVNDYMNTIASAVEEQSATTNEMARNVNEASKGSMEIAGNIVSVADAARGTTEGATQTQQASSELSRMASDLQRVVATLT